MKRLLTALIAASISSVAAHARAVEDLCHVYAVDVAKARGAQREYEKTHDAEKGERALAAAEVVFPEFSTVLGEEELTTKTYRFPNSRLYITASVFYTDESMASAAGADSMTLGVAVSRGPLKDALSAENNAVAELTDATADNARVKKYVRVGGRLYLLGLQCSRKRTADDERR